MSSSAALIEVVTVTKLFKWTINDFNKLNASNMKHEYEKVNRRQSRSIYILESPEMSAIDPYDGKQYTATFKLAFEGIHGIFSIAADLTSCQWKSSDSSHCYSS